jgi:hypothetical protein
MINKKKTNYSKFLTGAATATMVVSALTPAVGAEEIKVKSTSFKDVSSSQSEAINYVKDRGIVFGYEDGTFRPQQSIKREHAAVMIARAFGAEPNNNYIDAGFTDVSPDYAWAVNFLVAKGVVQGKSKTHFGAGEFTTRAQMAKIIANTYGLKEDKSSDFKFTDVSDGFKPYVKALFDNGVTVGKTVVNYGSNDFVTRGQFATFLHRVETVALVDDLEVLDVEIDNAREILVELNVELDKVTSTDKNNFVVTVDGKVIENFELELIGEFNNSLKITLSDKDKLKNKGVVDLEINDKVLAKTLKEGIEGGFKDSFVFEDNKAPVLVKAEKYGDDLLVTFDEFITTADLVKIDGNSITLPAITEVSEKTLLIEDATKYLSPGKHDILLSGVTDLLGNKSTVITTEIDVKADITAPTVSKIEQQDNRTFVVTFDKEVSFVGTDNIEVKKNGFNLKSSITKVESNKKFTVTLTDVDPLNVYGKDETKSVLDITVSGFKSKSNDLLGNKFVSKFTIEKDVTAPTLISSKSGIVNKGTDELINEVIEISFDEDIVLVGDASKLVVLDKDGIKQTVSGVEVFTNENGDKNSLRIEVSSIKDTYGKIKPGNYSVELPSEFVKDKYDNETIKNVITINKKSEDQKVNATAKSDNNVVTVEYDFEMGLSAINKDNYKIDGKPLSSDTKIYFDGTKKTVVIELAEESVKVTGGAVLSINDYVKSTYDVGINTEDKTILISSGFIDNVKPTLLSAKKLSTNAIELTFSESVNDATILDGIAENDFIVKVNGVSYAKKVSTGVANDNKFILTTDETFNFNSVIDVEVTNIEADISITDSSSKVNKLEKGTKVIAN